MTALDLLRFVAPVLLAAAAAWALDRLCAAKGLLPPGFHRPWRRAAAFAVIAGILWVGVFAPLGMIGIESEPDLAKLSTPQLFLLHVLLSGALVAWFLLGYAGLPRPLPAAPAPPLPAAGPDEGPGPSGLAGATAPPPIPSALTGIPEPGAGAGALAAVPPPAAAPPPRVPLGRQFLSQFGFRSPAVAREIGLGLLLGIGAWVVVLAALLALAALVWMVGGEKMMPKHPPAIIPWIAALPIAVRLLLSLSAGVVEESFFRGFLQPRMGILLSTAFFVLAHVSYGQPFMLAGVGILSLIYGFLVRWRRNIWPAIAAHALFDGVQLLVIVPAALRFMERAGAKATALVAFFG
jgi:membrane protease YdiL (CAAX protease family)